MRILRFTSILTAFEGQQPPAPSPPRGGRHFRNGKHFENLKKFAFEGYGCVRTLGRHFRKFCPSSVAKNCINIRIYANEQGVSLCLNSGTRISKIKASLRSRQFRTRQSVKLKKHLLSQVLFSGVPGGNRTHNRVLGGPRYIHLTTGRFLMF